MKTTVADFEAKVASVMGERVPSWWRSAVCAQVSPDLFDAEESGDLGAARAVCRRCPVIGQCMEALFVEEAGIAKALLAGVRAGMSATQRYQLYGHLCPTCGAQRDNQTHRQCSTCVDAGIKL